MSKELLQKVIDKGVEGYLNEFFLEVSKYYTELGDDLSEYDGNGFAGFQAIGEINFSPSEKLVVVTANIAGDLTERSGKKAQYEKAKKILKAYVRYDAGIFVFSDLAGSFRLSLIYGTPDATRLVWSNFRRFTYFVSKELTNKTFLDRVGTCSFASLEVIKDAFSVEKVTKLFYSQIADWYFWAGKEVTFPKEAEVEPEGRKISVIRLITRLIFIWFMKERGLVSPGFFDKQKAASLLKSLQDGETTYYKAILQNLFFATLNTKIEDRKFRFKAAFQGRNDDYMDHTIYRYETYFKNQDTMLELFKDIPFLNGGLFDCLDRRFVEDGKNAEIRIDGFSDKEVGLSVPNKLFFSDEIEVDVNEDYGTTNKRYKSQGLLNILSAYNFTIDENDPNDQEVALDPELLGKVFENLLASYNPETATTARKATGSYYTPREIVDYMVTESLKQYFKTHLQDVADIDTKLENLFSTVTERQSNPFGEADTRRMVALTNDLRIVDPAVGSGAFPMGILNKLVHILIKLDPENELWKQTQLKVVDDVPDPIIKQNLKAQITARFAEKNANYGRKLYLIEKCIYGVDIQQIAIEIAKLRFFIALLVDEKIDKSKYNWGVEPLPNLDFKLMQGNSLIWEFMGINLDADNSQSYGKLMKNELDVLIDEFQSRKSDFQSEADPKKKNQLKKTVENLIIKIFESKLKEQKAGYLNQLKNIENKYSHFSNTSQKTKLIAKEVEELNRKSGFDLKAAEKQLRDFTTGFVAKPFFAWKLYFAEVFHEKGGFDVVIANPPYIQIKGISPNDRRTYEERYQFATGRFNLFYLFVERTKLLLKQCAAASFIVPDRLLLNTQCKEIRKWLLNDNNICELVSFSDQVFETVVDSILLTFSKQKCQSEHIMARPKVSQSDIQKAQSILIPVSYFELSPSSQFDLNYNLSKFALFSKIKKTSVELWEIAETKDGIIQGKIEDRLFLKSKNDKDSKPLLFGENVKAYTITFRNNWVNYKPKDMMALEIKRRGEAVRPGLWMRDPAIFERPKILTRQTADEIIAAYDKDNFYYANTLHGTTITDKSYHPYYVLGVLNSKLATWYYRSNTDEEGKVFAQIKIELLKKLPIPIATLDKQRSLIDLVERIISAKKQNSETNTSALERQIDEMVYELYGLTGEEIAVVEGSSE